MSEDNDIVSDMADTDDETELLRANMALGSTSGAVANGTDTNAVTVTISDGSTLISGAVVTFFITNGAGASFTDGSQVISALTGVLGTAAVQVRSTVSGQVSIMASCYVSGQTLTATTAMQFGEGSGSGGNDGYVLDATVLADNSTANGSTTNTVLFSLEKNGVAVAGEYLVFTAQSQSGGAKLSSDFLQTDSSGYALVHVTNTTAEEVSVTATSVTSQLSATTAVTFSAEVHVYTMSYLITQNNMPADGSSLNQVRFTLLDNGLPAAGKLLTFLGTQGLSCSPNGVTDSNGHAVAYCSATDSSTQYKILGNYDEGRIDALAEGIQFSAALPQGVITSTVETSNIPANGSSKHSITYKISDGNGSPLSGIGISLALSSNTAKASATTLVTDSAGQASVTITDTVQEVVTVTAMTTMEGVMTSDIIYFGVGKQTYTASYDDYRTGNKWGPVDYTVTAGRYYRLTRTGVGYTLLTSCSPSYHFDFDLSQCRLGNPIPLLQLVSGTDANDSTDIDGIYFCRMAGVLNRSWEDKIFIMTTAAKLVTWTIEDMGPVYTQLSE